MVVAREWEKRPAVIFGVAFWNRRPMRSMLSHLPGTPRFYWSFEKALVRAKKDGASLFGWTTRISEAQRAQCAMEGVPVVNVEDGFVRSVGLGAAFVPAASLILDERGIYYDPSEPSDLEWLLEHQAVSDRERMRGASLRKRLIEQGVTKYNVGVQGAALPTECDRERILVPGQVSDDQSILKTRSDSLELCGGENPNLLLLKKVRAENPEAFIIFKPHPDVVSGLRHGGLSETQIRELADQVECEVDIVSLLNWCDKVETISSLTGFEALLRGKSVGVHGQPFYAGWGLTDDRTKHVRRTRMLQLDELVFLTLIRYPRYVDPVRFAASECEDVVRQLAEMRLASKKSPLVRLKLKVARFAFWLGL